MVQIPPAAALPCQWLYAPATTRSPLLSSCRRGGIRRGIETTQRPACARQPALRAGIAVVSLDCQLAVSVLPRQPVVDSRRRPSRGFARTQVAGMRPPTRQAAPPSGSDSAGGTLRQPVAALHARRDQGWPLALCSCSSRRARWRIRNHRVRAGCLPNGFLIDAAAIEWFAHSFDHYLPQGRRHDWRFAPMDG